MAPLLRWLEANWFNLVQSSSIVLGLVFAGLSFRRETRSRRLSNLLALKTEHRQLWNTIHSKPELARILRADVDLLAEPVRIEEEVFLRDLIVHVATAWELIRDGTPLDREAFRRDIAAFFSLPIPRRVWDGTTHAQAQSFIQFFESVMRNSCRPNSSNPVKPS